MPARVADDLRHSIEADRLGVEECRTENIRMMMHHLGRRIADLGKRCGAALGKPNAWPFEGSVILTSLDMLDLPAATRRRL